MHMHLIFEKKLKDRVAIVQLRPQFLPAQDNITGGGMHAGGEGVGGPAPK